MCLDKQLGTAATLRRYGKRDAELLKQHILFLVIGSRLILQEQAFQDKDLWIRTKQATKSGATNGALGDITQFIIHFVAYILVSSKLAELF